MTTRRDEARFIIEKWWRTPTTDLDVLVNKFLASNFCSDSVAELVKVLWKTHNLESAFEFEHQTTPEQRQLLRKIMEGK